MGSPFITQDQPTYDNVVEPSAAQLRFIDDMLVKRDWRSSDKAAHVARVAAISSALNQFGEGISRSFYVNRILHDKGEAPLSKGGASKLIDWLLDQPVKANAPVAAAPVAAEAEVPAGRYAVDTADGAVNALAFYKVDRPTEGRWAGYVFVKHLVGGGEERMSRAAGQSILAKIAAVGAAAASARYGHEIGECGVCGRRLTNDDSRERGIGPKCAEGMGW